MYFTDSMKTAESGRGKNLLGVKELEMKSVMFCIVVKLNTHVLQNMIKY